MKIKAYLFLSFVLVVVSFHTSLAQKHLDLQLGVAIPVADFGNDDLKDDDAGGANTGFTLGGRYTYMMPSTSGLGIFGGLDFSFHELKKSTRDQIMRTYEAMGLYGTEQDYYAYINMPLSAGLVYQLKIDETTGLMFDVGSTMNVFMMTDYKVRYQGYTITTTFENTTAIGFRVGTALLAMDKFLLRATYMNLGKNDIIGELSAPGQTPEKVEGQVKVSLLSLTAGYRF